MRGFRTISGRVGLTSLSNGVRPVRSVAAVPVLLPCRCCVGSACRLSLSAFAVMGAFFARVARLPFVCVFTRPHVLALNVGRFWRAVACVALFGSVDFPLQ